MLDKSKIVVLQKISIDGYPMKKRFPEAFEYLEEEINNINSDLQEASEGYLQKTEA